MKQVTPRQSPFMVGNNYPVFINKARNAASLANQSSSERSPLGIDGLIFSATALESFINDYPVLIKPYLVFEDRLGVQPDCIKTAFNALCDLEEQRMGTKVKFEILYFILTGKALDWGLKLYQNFDFLFSLRNEMIHPKARNINLKGNEFCVLETATLAQIKNGLRARKLLAGYEDYCGGLALILETKSMANWSAQVAIDVVNNIIDVTPDCAFKKGPLSSYIIREKAGKKS